MLKNVSQAVILVVAVVERRRWRLLNEKFNKNPRLATVVGFFLPADASHNRKTHEQDN
jgi:hypothetical protein